MSISYGTGTETKAQRTDEERDNNNHSNGTGESRCFGESTKPGEQVGVDNQDRTRRDSALRWGLAGGILDQLIKDAEDQLAKTEACIEWYEDEKKERLQRLDNLKRLREMAERQSQSE